MDASMPDYSIWTTEQRREVYVGSLLMNTFSFWSASFMFLNCLTIGKGRGVSAIVGVMMFTNCTWHCAQMIKYFFRLCGRTYEDDQCEAHELMVKYLSLCILLWMCILAAFLCYILYEAIEDSFHYVESNGMRGTDSLIGWKSWVFMCLIVFGIPLIPLVLMKKYNAISKLPGIDECAPSPYWQAFGWLLPGGLCIVFVFICGVISIVLTLRLIRTDLKVLPAFRIVGPWNPVIRMFLYVLGMLITIGPEVVIKSFDYVNNRQISATQALVLNLGMYSIGLWNCLVYSFTSKEIRKKYHNRWWLLIPTFIFSPILLPFAFIQWSRRVHYIRRSKATDEPLLRFSRPQKEVFSAF
eukprot:TRINITY_DN5747_c0_g1_i1.p1 TRINITY_DN5747_c0_g1~~TRINITY_DN5747_c0_g1_i1.p1  ORF type:complete len:354 (-),score=50.34 TRINITY_DN5747_c0_g1_i1:231-1292(-)